MSSPPPNKGLSVSAAELIAVNDTLMALAKIWYERQGHMALFESALQNAMRQHESESTKQEASRIINDAIQKALQGLAADYDNLPPLIRMMVDMQKSMQGWINGQLSKSEDESTSTSSNRPMKRPRATVTEEMDE